MQTECFLKVFFIFQTNLTTFEKVFTKLCNAIRKKRLNDFKLILFNKLLIKYSFAFCKKHKRLIMNYDLEPLTFFHNHKL